MFIDILKTYRWGLYWNQLNLNDSQLSDEQKILKSFLLGYFWQNPTLAYTTLESVDNKNSYEYIWVDTMISVSNADEENFLRKYTLCKNKNIPIEYINWIELEYYGRTSQYKILIDKFIEFSKQYIGWPHIVLFHILENDNTVYKDLISGYNLDSIDKSSPIEQILFKIKILINLKLYDQSTTFIEEIIDSTNNLDTISYLSYMMFINNVVQNRYDDNIDLLDIASKIYYMDHDLLIKWLTLSISDIDSKNRIKDRINYGLKQTPNQLKYKGHILGFALIYYWQIGDMLNIQEIINKFSSYIDLKLENRSRDQVFFIYIFKLYNFLVENKDLYISHNLYQELYTIGESHCLPLSNLPLEIDNKNYKGDSCFIMGIKMYHIGSNLDNRYKHALIKYINSIDKNRTFLFTIGEIDCRPDEGIWKHYKKSNTPLESIIDNTVTNYLDNLKNILESKKPQKVIIQGVPAPNYQFNIFYDEIDKNDISEFLDMISLVNKVLKEKTLKKGWCFLDIYGATVDNGKISNQKYHIDGMHIKPIFYKEINSFLIN